VLRTPPGTRGLEKPSIILGIQEKWWDKLGNKRFQIGLFSISGLCKVVGVLVIISIVGGCIGNGNKADLNLPGMNGSQNASQNNVTLAGYASDTSNADSNMVKLVIKPKEFDKTGRLPIMLKVTNPKLNETVITVLKPQFGQEWYSQARITLITNNSWTQNFSVKPRGNISYVRMFVQIYENNSSVRKAEWNITFGAPVGRPK
jgi:hypothetical protein